MIQNRWIQLCGFVVAMLMIANLQYAWTLFVQPLQNATGWKLSEIQWGFTLFIVFETWVMPLEGWLIDKMGPRIFITVAGVLCGVGWTALGYITQLWQLYVFYSIAGVGAAFVYSGSIAAALKWFPDRRGLASGIIAAGFGSGSALFIPLIAYLVRHYDYKVAFLYTGIAQVVIILAVAQILRNPGPEFSKTKAAQAAGSAKVRRNPTPLNTAEMLGTPHFYVLYVMFVMMATGGLMITAQAAPLAREWGISAAALTTALTLTRVANGFSRILWGVASDHLGREMTMFVTFLLQAACLLSVLLLGRVSGAWFVVTLTLAFFTWGQIFSLFPSITGDYFGTRNSASNYSFLYTAKGVSSIIGGGLTAVLFERFGSWTGAFYGSAALAALSAVMALGLRRSALPKK